ncbi:hypothetical protein I302_101608 [Kwoniella bestiolae CBS 10118]|uniref:NmrA-like domain-containing protein n=1 Tax=Kwoniella bestiolae CBS 10118 TaxID=1296100 RepID=A0A1B9GCQ3_9TREE|nr:hypothetical protein I302_00289 [Kwoniella bestiolae CBS 10118]OCF28800.1 hypothetical protein I302_00289 [Kwoniella bestiolae CBS 10118]
MSRSILVTGATGKQGGALIKHLISQSNTHTNKYTILAVTRNVNSTGAQKLQSLSKSIKLVQGDLDSPSDLFKAAAKVSPNNKIWGVFSVQTVSLRENDTNTSTEVKQGKGLIDEALKYNVEHFVYSSVDRGGEERSWNNPTPVPHFKTKHLIEEHLRDSTRGTNMGWTILRPVIFMENLVPGFGGKVFLTALRDTMGSKTMGWISTYDIGFFAAQAFIHSDSQRYNGRALSLAGEEFSWEEMNEKFKLATGKRVPTTFSFLGSALKVGVKEMGVMLDWFRDDGYKANVKELREINPDMLDLETWLKTRSEFVKR